MRRTPLAVGLLGLFLSATIPVRPSWAEDGKPETMIPALEFRVVDAGPGNRPVKSFHYSYDLYSAGLKKPLERPDVAYQAEDGVLRIPKPSPPFGRIYVWIHADDLQAGYRAGDGSFSYRIDARRPAEPPVIRLRQGIVLTGRVLDAETGKPVAGAEVAPLRWGHQLPWPDWDASVKTDREGKYRIATGGAEGIAVRHPDYRAREWERDPTHGLGFGGRGEPMPEDTGAGIVLRLQPLMSLRARAVDPDGKPIAGACPLAGEGSKSDAQGHFLVKVTREEWKDREKGRIGFYAVNHRWLNVPLKDFSLDRELVVTFQPDPLMRGQVLGADGKPLEDCTIEVGVGPDRAATYFNVIPGPHKQGKWERPIGQHDRVFAVWISVAGAVRSLRQYTLAEVTRGPIVTKLPDGRRLTGRLVAPVPLNEKNTPAVLLFRADREALHRQARVQPDGGFTFFGLEEGEYTFRLDPTWPGQLGAGQVNPGVGAFTAFRYDSPNKPWEKPVTVGGADVRLDPIDLHTAGVLPGRLKGTAYQAAAPHAPLANGFGYICAGENDFDSVGGSYYLLQFMTDADGRFQVDHCPPGQYVLRLTDCPSGYWPDSPSLWIRVAPEKTLELRPFAPGTAGRLKIDFVVGDGSPWDVHAGAGLDPDLIARHTDPKTGELPYLDDDGERLRAEPSTILCDVEPLDASITHWPIGLDRFEFCPRNLLKAGSRGIVVPNLSPGRWRLTLTAASDAVLSLDETLLTREFVFAPGMAPLKIELPPAALAGMFDNPARKMTPFGPEAQTTIEAIPRQPGLPARTCRGEEAFRFIGLAPGEYTLRFRAKGCQEKRVDGVLVRPGKVTWLDKIALKPGPSKKTPH